MKKITVGITEGRNYENYLGWFTRIPTIEVIKLSHAKNNALDVRNCNGIVLTGGEDVHPEFYNRPEYIEKYNLSDLDKDRDAFELEVLTHSQQLPILGICRGLQLVNVFFGGTLIPDIPSFGKLDHSKHQKGKDHYHNIRVVKNTLLEDLTGSSGEVNSAHHQSVDILGEGLMINAVSDDGIIEGMERENKSTHPFLLLVQWHPERMIDQESPFSMNLRDSFVEALKA
ncbi:gamma-glutamyl-gamma-aminobutyrate hydrolase family protein [soil metagenome]